LILCSGQAIKWLVEMNEEFQIPVLYKGKEFFLTEMQLQLGAYTHKFQVDLNGTIVLFEVDQERNYRAIVNQEKVEVFLDRVNSIYRESH
jgi:hypothetical protein